ncbi:MAG: P-loop NTPase [Pseudomonadota bacterium]|jgi:ATP-binding protein involved in chromosome partitioning|nr:ATP-binding protein [Gammaproteobacteria bacterium]MEC7774258.1 P-loop NTPase [Pseudomonadota bacterium]|tara:strand:+ start:112 stop:792 length:681 start_codon:yes stop_codon:yes gene_type:complete
MSIKNIIAICSAKGGVGKSTITAAIALSISKQYQVGILDADVYGPNQHILFDIKDKPQFITKNDDKYIKPFISKNIEIMSMGLMTESDEAVAWRGPMLSSAVRQLSNSTKWSNLDFLFIDMPPGTGDTYLTIFKELNLSNVILVTTPNKLSYADIKKTINLVNKFNVPIMGYIENNIFNQDKDTSSEKLSINKLGKFNFSEKMLNFDLDNDIEDANLISKKIIAHV